MKKRTVDVNLLVQNDSHNESLIIVTGIVSAYDLNHTYMVALRSTCPALGWHKNVNLSQWAAKNVVMQKRKAIHI